MRTRHLVIALAAVSCAPAIAACGSSGKGNAPAAGAQPPSLVGFADCMHAHGVTGFPDPTASPPPSLSGYSAVIRRGVYLAIPDTINMASPIYKEAAAACRFGPVFS